MKACSKIQEKIVGNNAIPCPMEAMRNSVCLDSAKNCLVVRPRSGEDQIRFIQKCLPNLEALTAIDIDLRSLANFHENVSACFPDMSLTFSPESSKILSEWSGTESQFDVVLLFYPGTPFDSERTKALLEKSLLRWLKPGGSVFVSNSCWDEDTERIDTTVLVLKALDKNYRAYRIKEFISSLGFCVKREFSSEMRLDVSNMDPGRAAAVQICLRGSPRCNSNGCGVGGIARRCCSRRCGPVAFLRDANSTRKCLDPQMMIFDGQFYSTTQSFFLENFSIL